MPRFRVDSLRAVLGFFLYFPDLSSKCPSPLPKPGEEIAKIIVGWEQPLRAAQERRDGGSIQKGEQETF